MEQREASTRLYACLSKLKEAQRVPLVFYELDGMPCERIAELMGISVPAVWTRIHRGRAQLLRHLQRLEAEEEWRAMRRAT